MPPAVSLQEQRKPRVPLIEDHKVRQHGQKDQQEQYAAVVVGQRPEAKVIVQLQLQSFKGGEVRAGLPQIAVDKTVLIREKRGRSHLLRPGRHLADKRGVGLLIGAMRVQLLLIPAIGVHGRISGLKRLVHVPVLTDVEEGRGILFKDVQCQKVGCQQQSGKDHKQAALPQLQPFVSKKFHVGGLLSPEALTAEYQVYRMSTISLSTGAP